MVQFLIGFGILSLMATVVVIIGLYGLSEEQRKEMGVSFKGQGRYEDDHED